MVWLWVPEDVSAAPEAIRDTPAPSSRTSHLPLPNRPFVLEIKQNSESEYIFCSGASRVPSMLFPFVVIGVRHPFLLERAGGAHGSNASFGICEEKIRSPGFNINPATRMTSLRLRSWLQQPDWQTLVVRCGAEEGVSQRCSEGIKRLERLEQAAFQYRYFPPATVAHSEESVAWCVELLLHVPPAGWTAASRPSATRVTLDPVPRAFVERLLENSNADNIQQDKDTDAQRIANVPPIRRLNTVVGGEGGEERWQLYPALAIKDAQCDVKSAIMGVPITVGCYLAISHAATADGEGENDAATGRNIYYFRVADVAMKRRDGTAFEGTSRMIQIAPSTNVRLNLAARGSSCLLEPASSRLLNKELAVRSDVAVGLDSEVTHCLKRIQRAVFESSFPYEHAPCASLLLTGPSGCGKHSVLRTSLASLQADPSSAIIDTIYVQWGLEASTEGSPTSSITKESSLSAAFRSAGCSGDVSSLFLASTLNVLPTMAHHGTATPTVVCVLSIEDAAKEFPADDVRLTRLNTERLMRGMAIIEEALQIAVRSAVSKGAISWPTGIDAHPLLGVAFVVAAFAPTARCVSSLVTSSLFGHGIVSSKSSGGISGGGGVIEVPLPGVAQREALIASRITSVSLESDREAQASQAALPETITSALRRIGQCCSRAAARFLMGVSGRDCTRVGSYINEELARFTSMTTGQDAHAALGSFAASLGRFFRTDVDTRILECALEDISSDSLVAAVLGIQPPPSTSASATTAFVESATGKVAPVVMGFVRIPGLVVNGLTTRGGLPDEGTVAGTSWNDIGGLADVKERLRKALILPRLYPDAFRRFSVSPPKGILLYGPPGCAKTTLVKALCNEGLYSFIYVDCASVLSSYVGESEQFLRDIFHKGRAQAPCIVFFDEVEGVSGNRAPSSGGGGDSARLLSTLLIEIDGFATASDDLDSHVCFVGATNLPHLVDPALLRPGRFDYLVEVPLPTAAERYSIIIAILQRGQRATTTTLQQRQRPPLNERFPSTYAGLFTPNGDGSEEVATTAEELGIAVQRFVDCVLDPTSIGFFSLPAGDVPFANNASSLSLPTDLEALRSLSERKTVLIHTVFESINESRETRNDSSLVAETQLLALKACAADTLVSLCDDATDGFSGADLTSLVKEAAAIRQRHEGKGVEPLCHITLRDIEAAALLVHPVDFDRTALENFRDTH